MLPMNHILCKTLLLSIVISNAFANVHAAGHVSANSGECVLCATHGSPTAVLPDSGFQLPPMIKNIRIVEFCHSAEWTSSISYIHSRGPPLAR